jgi:hypothetical protein
MPSHHYGRNVPAEHVTARVAHTPSANADRVVDSNTAAGVPGAFFRAQQARAAAHRQRIDEPP